MDRIPSTFNVKEMASFAKLFDTWYDERKKRDKEKRNKKIKDFIARYMGWLVAGISAVKPLLEIYRTW